MAREPSPTRFRLQRPSPLPDTGQVNASFQEVGLRFVVPVTKHDITFVVPACLLTRIVRKAAVQDSKTLQFFRGVMVKLLASRYVLGDADEEPYDLSTLGGDVRL